MTQQEAARHVAFVFWEKISGEVDNHSNITDQVNKRPALKRKNGSPIRDMFQWGKMWPTKAQTKTVSELSRHFGEGWLRRRSFEV